MLNIVSVEKALALAAVWFVLLVIIIVVSVAVGAWLLSIVAIAILLLVGFVRSRNSPYSFACKAHDLAGAGHHGEALALYDQAIAAFAKAEREYPDYMIRGSGFGSNWGYKRLGETCAWKAQSLCALGRFDEALEMTELAMELYEKNPYIRYTRIAVLSMCGLHDEALEFVDRCMENASRNVLFSYSKVLVLLNVGKYDEAVCLSDHVVSASPKEACSHASRAMVLYQAGDIEGAYGAIDRAVSLVPRREKTVSHRFRHVLDNDESIYAGFAVLF